MEKNEFGSILIYLIMVGLLLLVSKTVVVLVLNNIETPINQFAYILICALVSLVLFEFVYQIGHIIGAKIGKYKCIYFNMFGLCFYKDNEKWRFKLDGFDGLFSETRFVPVNNEVKSNPAHFLRGGIVSFLLSVVVGFAIFMISALPDTVRFATLIYFGIGLVLLLYNIIPMKTDILNDGYRLKLLGTKENAKAYNDFMRIENNKRKGIADGEYNVYETITPMTVLINNHVFYKKLAVKDYAAAEQIVDIILKKPEALDTNTIYRYRIQKLFFVIITKSKEEASEYYWKEMSSYDRKFLAKDNYIPSKRVYLLVSGIINESESESRIAIEGMKKRINRMVDATQKNAELQLYITCLEMVMKNLGSDDLINYFN